MEDSAQINKAKNQSRKKGKKGEEGRRNIPKMPLESPVQDAPHSAIEYFVQYSNKKKLFAATFASEVGHSFRLAYKKSLTT